MAIQIRSYATGDQKQIWEVHSLAIAAEGFPKSVAEKDFDSDIEAEYQSRNGEFIVAVEGDKIIGMGGLRRVSRETGEITRMRVLPEHQRRGIGKLILQRLEELARGFGYKRIRLDTANRNVIGFYQKHGYNLQKQEFDGTYDCYYFEKALV